MKELYYIPIVYKEGIYVQRVPFDLDEFVNYRFENYNDIIKKHFKPIAGIVRLDTGKYETVVYQPIDSQIEIHFCLIDNNSIPPEGKELTFDENLVGHLQEYLSMEIRTSEGILPEQIVDLYSNFVTPSIRFGNWSESDYYKLNYFDSDCFIIGPPGAGKTTLLRRITLDKIYNDLESENSLKSLPVYVQLREYNDFNSDFTTYLNNCIVNTFNNINIDFKFDAVSSGKLILMLDGADEIDFTRFKAFKHSIEKFKSQNPLVSFIITSRPDRSFENLKSFDTCYIEPFNEKQIKELSYRKLFHTGKWKEFVSILNDIPEVKDVLRNPLMLTISHYLFKNRSILPLNSGQLINELVHTLISDWDAGRNVERKLNASNVNPKKITNALGKVALYLSEKKKQEIGFDEVKELFIELEDEEELRVFLEYIEFATGILKHKESDTWAFNHKSIQDFFCSAFLVESIRELDDRIFKDNDWSQIVTMISGISSDPNYLINSILSDQYLNDNRKLSSSLDICSESVLIEKGEIKRSFDLLNTVFCKLEQSSELGSENISYQNDEIMIEYSNNESKIRELIDLIHAIYKIRYTKYEYDFFGYLRNSGSRILKILGRLNKSKGNITMDYNNGLLKIKFDKESPHIDD